jgi:uncharacterized delta-60 repeat protein
LNSDGSLDQSFNSPVLPFTEDFGLGGILWSVAVQADGKILAGGRVRIDVDGHMERGAGVARFNVDGTIDENFELVAPVGDVLAITVQRDGRILVGGGSVDVPDGSPLPVSSHIARLNRDGSIDPTFNPGTGEDHSVNAIAIQDDRRIVIGGAFRTVNGVPRAGLARLNPDGSLDRSFNPLVEGLLTSLRGGFTALPGVFAVALDHRGRILIGGTFTHVNGSARGGVARLNPDGSLDGDFDSGIGADAPVSALALDKHDKILLGGDFAAVNGIERHRVARLEVDGSVDLTFIPIVLSEWTRALAIERRDAVLLGGAFYFQADVVSLIRLRLGKKSLDAKDVAPE